MFARSILTGIGHIGALASQWYGPEGFHLPDGMDHILFLVALALAGGGFWQLVKTATGFTLGHSVTLALAFFGVVHLPSRWVEAAIAFSIAYMAAEDLLRKEFRHRWQLAAAFGLVHGFGFATALETLHLARADALRTLAGFNVGVEIGQGLILLALVPIVNAMSQEPVLKKYGLGSCSFAVFVVGAYWFFRRALA